MKLIIKQKGKIGIRLWLPNRLLFSKTSFNIFRRSLAKSEEMPEIPSPDAEDQEEVLDYRQLLAEESSGQGAGSELAEVEEEDSGKGFDFQAFMANLPDEKVDQVIGIIRNMKKDHPGVPLVDVHSADGDRVLIQL